MKLYLILEFTHDYSRSLLILYIPYFLGNPLLEKSFNPITGR